MEKIEEVIDELESLSREFLKLLKEGRMEMLGFIMKRREELLKTLQETIKDWNGDPREILERLRKLGEIDMEVIRELERVRDETKRGVEKIDAALKFIGSLKTSGLYGFLIDRKR